jgi:hypothetical protein
VSTKLLRGIVAFIAILVVLTITLLETWAVRSDPDSATPTPPCVLEDCSQQDYPLMDGATVVPPIETDLYPEVPYEEKASVFVRHPDGSEEVFLVLPDAVEAFIAQLPPEDVLLLVNRPASQAGIEPPSIEPPTATFGPDAPAP